MYVYLCNKFTVSYSRGAVPYVFFHIGNITKISLKLFPHSVCTYYYIFRFFSKFQCKFININKVALVLFLNPYYMYAYLNSVYSIIIYFVYTIQVRSLYTYKANTYLRNNSVPFNHLTFSNYCIIVFVSGYGVHF